MRFKKGRIIFAIFIIIVAILIGLMHADAANEKTIAFEDENLYIQVKDSLGDKVKSFDNDKKTITVDVDEVTSLYIFKNEIKSLDGIEQFPNLTSLSISNGEAIGGDGEDVHTESKCKLEGLDKLSQLTKLTDLSLLYCQINDVDMQYFENLTNLKKLNLSYNEISDVNKLTNLTKLDSLTLTGNKIVDINPLNKLEKVTSLDISKNNICDVSVLASMRNITSLKCSSNQISDISVISNLTKLKSFSCNNNDVSDISSLSDLRCLEEVYLTGNKIIDFSPLIELPLLDIDDTYITMIGKQNIQINVKDGDVVKLPPVVKQAFELFEPAEGIDCINCKVTPDYEYCEIDPGVEGARMRISKGSMKDTIIILKPGEETESNYKLSETEKKQIKEGKENEKAIISLPKALVITLAILIIGLWVGSIVFICKKNGSKDGTSKDLKAKNSKKNDVAEKQDKKTDDKKDN